MCGLDIADVAAELAIEQLGQPLWGPTVHKPPVPRKVPLIRLWPLSQTERITQTFRLGDR